MDSNSLNQNLPISWSEFHMGLALLSAQRSKDPCTKVGAVAVDKDGKIISIGYNGFPRGCPDSQLPWTKDPHSRYSETKFGYVVHAEMNVIANAIHSPSLQGSTLYCTFFPCNLCTQMLIQTGIKKVVYLSDENHDKEEWIASRRMLDLAGVVYEPYVPTGRKLEINL